MSLSRNATGREFQRDGPTTEKLLSPRRVRTENISTGGEGWTEEKRNSWRHCRDAEMLILLLLLLLLVVVVYIPM